MEGVILETGQQVDSPISQNWVWLLMDITDRLDVLISIHSSRESAEQRMAEEKAKPLTSSEHILHADTAKWLFERGGKMATQGDIRSFLIYKKPVEE